MRINHILIAGCLLLLASCVKEQFGGPAEPQSAAPGFSATLASDPGFAIGGQIGIYMLRDSVVIAGSNGIPADNRRYVIGIDTLIPAEGQRIDFPNDTDPVDFVAYFPWRTLTDRFYPLNDTTDLLRATHTGSRANPAIPLQFDHVLARITLMVKRAVGLSGTITALVDSLPVGAKIDLLAGTLALASNDTLHLRGIPKSQFVKPDLMAAPDTLFTTLVVPHAQRNGREVVFTMSGKKYRWNIPADLAPAAGKHYAYALTLRADTQVEVNGTSAIDGWDEDDTPTPVTSH